MTCRACRTSLQYDLLSLPVRPFREGHPCSSALSVGHPCSSALSEGHPCSSALSEGHPCSSALSVGHPCSSALSVGHPCSSALSVGHPCSSALRAGHPCSSALRVGHPCSSALSEGLCACTATGRENGAPGVSAVLYDNRACRMSLYHDLPVPLSASCRPLRLKRKERRRRKGTKRGKTKEL